MLWSGSQFIAGFLLLSSLLGCGGPPSLAQETPQAIAAPAAPLSEDQQILLDPVAVDSTLPAPTTSSRPASPEELHQAAGLAEVALAGAPDALRCQNEVSTVSGQVVLSLEIDPAGKVLGGATTPAGGEEGLAAVADCLLSRARAWKFPSRTRPGRTVLIVPFDFGR